MGISVNWTPVGAVGGLSVLAGQNKYKRLLEDRQRADEARQQDLNARLFMQQQSIDAQREGQAASLAAQKEGQQFQASHQKERDAVAAYNDERMKTFEYDQRKQMAQAGYDHDTQRQKAGFDQQKNMLSAETNEQNKRQNQAEQFRRDQILQQISNLKANNDLSEEQRNFALQRKQAELDRFQLRPTYDDVPEPKFGTSESGNEWMQTPDGKTQVIKQPSQDRPQIDAKMKQNIWESVEKSMLAQGLNPTDEQIRAKVDERISYLSGPESRDAAPPAENPDNWTDAQRATGMKAEQAAMASGVRDALTLVKTRDDAVVADREQQRKVMALATARAGADPGFAGIPIEQRGPLYSAMESAIAEVQALKQSGGDTSAAKAKLAQIMEQVKGMQAVKPPAPPPEEAAPKYRPLRSLEYKKQNSVTYKGKTVSKDR